MSKTIKVTRTIEYEGDPDAILEQLNRSLKLGEHRFHSKFVIRVVEIAGEPITKASTAAFDAVKSFCRN
jgi:hypothetical protein